MDRTNEAVDEQDRIEADTQVSEETACIMDNEPSAEERLRDAYRLW